MIAEIGLGEILWTLLVVYVMVMYVVVVVTVWLDIFRSDDLSGGMKAVWVLGLLFVPIVSLVVYLIARGDSIGMRNLARTRDLPTSPVPAPPAPATELAVAKQLVDAGTITPAEFEQIKSRVLS